MNHQDDPCEIYLKTRQIISKLLYNVLYDELNEINENIKLLYNTSDYFYYNSLLRRKDLILKNIKNIKN